jgi:trimethylamine:corrinoid methyltransferase-like protein
MQPHTLKRCRDEFFIPALGIRTHHNSWIEMEPRDITEKAIRILEKRLAGYEKPEMDPTLAKKLTQFVSIRKHDT